MTNARFRGCWSEQIAAGDSRPMILNYVYTVYYSSFGATASIDGMNFMDSQKSDY